MTCRDEGLVLGFAVAFTSAFQEKNGERRHQSHPNVQRCVLSDMKEMGNVNLQRWLIHAVIDAVVADALLFLTSAPVRADTYLSTG